MSDFNHPEWSAYCSACGQRVDYYLSKRSDGKRYPVCGPRKRERAAEQYKRDKYRRLGIY